MRDKIKEWLLANIESYLSDPECGIDWAEYLVEDCIGGLEMEYSPESEKLVNQILEEL